MYRHKPLALLPYLLPSSATALVLSLGACDPIDTSTAQPTAGTGGDGGSTVAAGTGGMPTTMAGTGGMVNQAGTASAGNMNTGGTTPTPTDPSCPPELLALGVPSGQRGPAPPTLSRFVSDESPTVATADAGVADGGSSPDASSGSSDGSNPDASTGSSDDAGALATVDAGAVDAGPGGRWVSDVTDLFGWAQVAGIGVDQTTGGAEAPVVTATSARALAAFAQRDEPLYIQVCGQFPAEEIRVSSDKTIVGLGPNSGIIGGLAIEDDGDDYVSNVIVRNLKIDASSSLVDGEGIRIRRAHHVWVDHVELHNSASQLLSVIEGSDYITLSWNHFYFDAQTPDPDRRFGILIGDSGEPQAGALDGTHLNTTLHHNWFTDRVRQRSPRARWGDIHVLNNYYTVAGEWAMWAGTGSKLFIESNYFDNTLIPHQQAEVQYEPNPPFGEITAAGNIYDNTSGDQTVQGEGFVPPYEYPVTPAAEVPDLVMQNVGPQ